MGCGLVRIDGTSHALIRLRHRKIALALQMRDLHLQPRAPTRCPDELRTMGRDA
jgi:hypothetical protein